MKRLLITGAAGNIGQILREEMRGLTAALRVSDIAPLGEARSGEEIAYADLRDLDQVMEVMKGVDAVVHLGGISNEDSWDNIRSHNIDGVYNVLEAARRSNVSRVVFASSSHTIGFYRRARIIDADVPFRADSLYGASKAFGEILGRLYADKFGLQIVCVRIGSVSPRPTSIRALSIWISPRDLTSLVRASLTATDVHFEVVYGTSGNTRSWWNNVNVAKIGYQPQDNSEFYADDIVAQGRGDSTKVGRLFQGGHLCDDTDESIIDLIV